MEDSKINNGWECPKCGETNEITINACWKCSHEKIEGVKLIYKEEFENYGKGELQTNVEKKSISAKRPIVITIICVWLFLGLLVGVKNIVATGSTYSIAYQALQWFSVVVGVFYIVELWNMQKWGVYAFIGIFVLNLIVDSLMGFFSLVLLVPLIVIGVLLFYIKKMV